MNDINNEIKTQGSFDGRLDTEEERIGKLEDVKKKNPECKVER